ncbi:hypothetical protein D3C78_510200 [compost metagenome]
MTTLPSPWLPRWKSMLRIALPAGTNGFGAWLTGWATAATLLAAACEPPTTTNRLLPSARVV